jgi:glc operon protein GlcG
MAMSSIGEAMKNKFSSVMPKFAVSSLLGATLVCASALAESGVYHPPALHPDAAMTMLEACRAHAKKNNWYVSIAVVDAHGSLLAFHRMENTSFNSIQSAQLKARTSAIVRSSTKALAEKATSSESPPLVASQQVALGFYAAEGGIPIKVGDTVIGAIGVGGKGPAEDAACAQVGIDAVFGTKK